MNTTIFQSHHAIEQVLFGKFRALRVLDESGLVLKDDSKNRLFLPTGNALSGDLDLSKHSGRTLASYNTRMDELLVKI